MGMFCASNSTVVAKCLNPARISNWAMAVSLSAAAKAAIRAKILRTASLWSRSCARIAITLSPTSSLSSRRSPSSVRMSIRTVLEQQIRAAQFALHAHRRLTHVEQNLARELSVQPLHANTVFEHPERSDFVMLYETLVPLKRASLGSGRV
jgi:hypothetical protein